MEDILIITGSLCISFLLPIYILIRNEWVFNRRLEHVDRNIDEFHKIASKFSYNTMMLTYFYIWDYNWFVEKALERK